MTNARIIDGVALANVFREQIKARAASIRQRGGRVRLDAVLVEAGDNSARVYAENQAKTSQMLDIDYRLHRIAPASLETAFDEIAGRVLLLSSDEDVTAMMLHVPMPQGVDPYRVQRLIAPEKDVEGVNPANIGNIVYGRSSLAPCTGLAVMKMLEWVWQQKRAEGEKVHETTIPFLRGKIAVVVGAGDVVGKPIAVLLMRQEATVISCNKWTPGLAEIAKTADVLVAAAGVPGLITAEMVKPGAVVVDVGVNRFKGPDGKVRTVGDVCFDSVSHTAGWLSPVPGGVGPMTVAMLLLNVVEVAERRLK
ncbi:MAG: bifunctional 5,10-methylenetetrahydrofolate dehydrogenase/5,10-methenyltetrahydrofolate cyclohydrolase [Planctomycetes bacterium]|nr:bifunctional 5,10-methylenetetrahydrofolate dehydrogenase/5,10-methenyltetrahydrofolate cyclohydrolase [Planctomycetota bacterium]